MSAWDELQIAFYIAGLAIIVFVLWIVLIELKDWWDSQK